MKATIVDLRYRMKDVLRAIDRGEPVTVLHRGKVRATLTPVVSAEDAAGECAPKTDEQPFFGMWKDREDITDPTAWVRQLREPRIFPSAAPKRRAAKKRR